jgi:microcystin-dependent protein
MADPFVGEIRLFGGNFAPVGWAFCNGALMAISQNDALYALLGTTYGGDGVNTFAVPNLQGRLPIHMGTGPGLSPVVEGQAGGQETVTVITSQLPGHTHAISASTATGTKPGPGANLLAAGATTSIYTTNAANNSLNAASMAVAGNSQPHDNMQPYQCVTFIIALEGIFPSQN